jgi:uncharacterized protein
LQAIFESFNRTCMSRDYKIQFSGLAEGQHEFAFMLEKPFFDQFEDEVIRDGRIDVALVMEKQTRMLIFNFDIKGTIEVLCDRCADPLLLNIEGAEQLIARISESDESDDDDIVFIHEEDFEFDLTQHLFDYVHLLLPMRLIHDDSADGRSCDPEMLKLIRQYSSHGTNEPRWSGLAGLKGDEEDSSN